VLLLRLPRMGLFVRAVQPPEDGRRPRRARSARANTARRPRDPDAAPAAARKRPGDARPAAPAAGKCPGDSGGAAAAAKAMRNAVYY
jgi:hypothetical protein